MSLKKITTMKSINKYWSVLAAILGLLPVTSPADDASPQADKKPNIVFILADDAGIGDFSPYGCKYGVTPNIDRLAAEGMKFTRAYSGSAVCAPLLRKVSVSRARFWKMSLWRSNLSSS